MRQSTTRMRLRSWEVRACQHRPSSDCRTSTTWRLYHVPRHCVTSASKRGLVNGQALHIAAAAGRCAGKGVQRHVQQEQRHIRRGDRSQELVAKAAPIGDGRIRCQRLKRLQLNLGEDLPYPICHALPLALLVIGHAARLRN
eukprot:scaffold1017_cov374-Prasinococcus_capsulatus_cf.AAC.17